MINFVYGNAPYIAQRVDSVRTLVIFKILRGILVSIMILPDKSAPLLSTQLLLLQAITVYDRLFDPPRFLCEKKFNITRHSSCFSHFDDRNYTN